jgi:hypothetical protein
MPYAAEPLPPDATQHDLAEAAFEPLEYADGVLIRHGIRCRPSLATAGADGVVTLRPTRRFAVQGAALVGVAALIAGGVISKIALVGFAPVVLIGIGLVAWQMPRLDRWAPRSVPRGRMLGALLMLILLAVASIVVVEPLRERARDQGNRANAIVLTQEADSRLATGNLAGALTSAASAVANDSAAPGVQEMYARVDAAGRARLAEAEASRAAGQWEQAIEQLESLAPYYDTPLLIAEVRREAGVSSLAAAKAAFKADDPTTAFNLYNKAIAFDPEVADPYLLGAIIYALRKS